jgi:predicted dinucleotide-binding enzyme
LCVDKKGKRMKIGTIGAGNIGATATGLFAESGHEVVISNSRGPETLPDVVQGIGGRVSAVTIEEAADFGEVVLEAISFGRYEELPVDRLKGKVVIDPTNYYPGRDGDIDLEGLTSTGLVARHLAESRVVKAFNTLVYKTLASEGKTDAPVEDRLVLFVPGDDAEAKSIVSDLIEQIGFAPVDTGTLNESGKQEPDAPVYNTHVTPDRAREMLASY